MYADITGVGGYIVEDMVRSGIQTTTGVTFTVQSKEEMATILREKMQGSEAKIAYIPASRLGDVDLTAELNIEKYELMKTGHIKFSHPEGGHDDVFRSMALAIYASAQTSLPGARALGRARLCLTTENAKKRRECSASPRDQAQRERDLFILSKSGQYQSSLEIRERAQKNKRKKGMFFMDLGVFRSCPSTLFHLSCLGLR